MKFSPEDQKSLLERFQADVDLFRRQELMDYSLLLSISVDTTMEDRRKSYNEFVDDKYVADLKAKYAGNKNVVISPTGYIYNMGVIDYLQEYNFMKRLENRFKRYRFGAEKMLEISAIEPDPYAIRFMHFVKREVLNIVD